MKLASSSTDYRMEELTAMAEHFRARSTLCIMGRGHHIDKRQSDLVVKHAELANERIAALTAALVDCFDAIGPTVVGTTLDSAKWQAHRVLKDAGITV